MELWTPFEAELRARGLDASNGIRMICAEWLRREQRRGPPRSTPQSLQRMNVTGMRNGSPP